MRTMILGWLIVEALKTHKCLNGMEICRTINGHSPFNYRHCGTPVKWKPFKNKGKILQEYRKQTGNGICAHHAECPINYKKVLYTLNRMQIKSTKRTFEDSRARIKKSKFKTDIFRFFYLEESGYKTRIQNKTLEPYLQREKL